MNLILHNDKVYETVESKYYTGHQPVQLVKGEPRLSWKGGKIPMDEWNKILSFFKWSYDETKSETQVRLLYNPDENNWVAWAFPQEHGTGMTTKEIDGEKFEWKEKFVELRENAGAPSPENTADKIYGLLPRLKDELESGSFVDIRKL